MIEPDQIMRPCMQCPNNCTDVCFNIDPDEPTFIFCPFCATKMKRYEEE